MLSEAKSRWTSGKRNGFTLIELLVVIAIIVILASVLLPQILGARGAAKEGTARMEMDNMNAIFAVYKEDTGDYPTSNSDFSSAPLISELKGDPTATPPKKDYLADKKLKLNAKGEWLSPLDNPYFYRNNWTENYGTSKPAPADVHRKDSYDLWTADCNTMEKQLSPLEIAQKSRLCNWK